MSDGKQEGAGMPVPYELYALRYATRVGRRPEFFLGGDPHSSDEMLQRYIVASPTSHVNTETPPTLLIHGGHDATKVNVCHCEVALINRVAGDVG